MEENDFTAVDFPTPNDRLFRSDCDRHLNACVNWQDDAISAYADGQKYAADIICSKVIEDRNSLDTLIYPICSLYRQYIELRLKEIIRDGYIVFKINRGVPKHHKLFELWKEVKGIASRLWPDESGNVLENLEHLIEEFDTVDFDSQDFRYPTKKDGSRTLTGITHINVRNLRDVMGRIANLLDGISCGASNAKFSAFSEPDKKK
jgi:hypothetical protein